MPAMSLFHLIKKTQISIDRIHDLLIENLYRKWSHPAKTP